VRVRFGLQARFLVGMGIVLLGLLLLFALLWQRQRSMEDEVSTLGRESMRQLVSDRLRKRGELAVAQLADTLTNPMYYSDLDAIGTLTRTALRQPDVEYVIVFDPQGRIVHDGSDDIPAYGQPMADALAFEVVSARGLHTQASDNVTDISAPIMIGGQRLGGVRVGYSLASMRRDEEQATAGMRARLEEISQRHMGWIALAGLLLLALTAIVVALVQRTLVRPIRQLADVAREIESGNFEIDTPVTTRGD
jgi:HAMP domain-containing protein